MIAGEGDKKAAFMRAFEVQIAMWADENLFGHDLNDDDYEREAEMFADELHESTWRTLSERPIR